MTEYKGGGARLPRMTRTRAAAAGFGLGAMLALSPMVWAQDPPAASQASPIIPQQSFAPLVKRVQPAVVNISVTEKSGVDIVPRVQINTGGAEGGQSSGAFQALIGMLLSEKGVAMLGNQVAANDAPPQPPSNETIAAE